MPATWKQWQKSKSLRPLSSIGGASFHREVGIQRIPFGCTGPSVLYLTQVYTLYSLCIDPPVLLIRPNWYVLYMGIWHLVWSKSILWLFCTLICLTQKTLFGNDILTARNYLPSVTAIITAVFRGPWRLIRGQGENFKVKAVLNLKITSTFLANL